MRAIQGRRVPAPAVTAAVTTALIGVLDECIQAFVPGRVFDVGTGAGGMLASFRAAGSDTAGCDFDDRYLDVGRRAGLDLKTATVGLDVGRVAGIMVEPVRVTVALQDLAIGSIATTASR